MAFIINNHVVSQEDKEITVLQLEKDLRTQVELMRKQKKERKQELKLLQEQDQELREILCMPPCDVDSTSVPTLEELNLFRQRVATLRETKVCCLHHSFYPETLRLLGVFNLFFLVFFLSFF